MFCRGSFRGSRRCGRRKVSEDFPNSDASPTPMHGGRGRTCPRGHALAAVQCRQRKTINEKIRGDRPQGGLHFCRDFVVIWQDICREVGGRPCRVTSGVDFKMMTFSTSSARYGVGGGAAHRMPKGALMSGFEKPPKPAPNVEKGADDVAFRSSDGAFSVHWMQSQTPIRFTRGSASD